MDPLYAEFAKGGVLVLAFGVLLVFFLKMYKSMGDELKEDKAKVLKAFTENTEAISGLRNVLRDRACLVGDQRVENLGRMHRGANTPDGEST